MTKFKQYVERRESVEAFQLREESQAADVVTELGLAYDHTQWSLNRTGYQEFHLIVTPRDHDEVRVNRGDYIVRSPVRDKFNHWIGERVDVVPPAEFLQKWQEA